MQQKNKKLVTLAVLGIVAIAVVVVLIQGGYSFGLNKFFAAEPQFSATCDYVFSNPTKITKVNLSWNSVEGIMSYVIQKKTDTGLWQRLTTAAEGRTTFTDTNIAYGHTYSYQIRYALKPTPTATPGMPAEPTEVKVKPFSSIVTITPTTTSCYSTTPTPTPTPTQASALNIVKGPNPASSLVAGGDTKTAFVFLAQTQYGSFTLDEATFKLTSPTALSIGAVNTLYLKTGSTVVGSSPASAEMLLTGLNVAIPLGGGTKTFTVEVKTNSVGQGVTGTAGLVQVQLASIKYHDSAGNVLSQTFNASQYSGPALYVVKAYPKFTNLALPSTVLANGTKTLFKTKLSAIGNTVAWRKLLFTVAVGPHTVISGWKFFFDGADLTSLGTLQTRGHNFTVAGAGTGLVEVTFPADRFVTANDSSVVELKGVIGGTNGPGDVVTTKLYPAWTSVAPGTYAQISATPASFVWSDISAPNHSSVTQDWIGDYLVERLGESQSLYQ